MKKIINFLLLMTLLLPLSEGRASPTCNLQQVPENLQFWMNAEQTRLSRGYQDWLNFFLRIHDSIRNLNFHYWPDHQPVFSINSYWLSSEDTEVFSNDQPTPEFFTRVEGSKTDFRILVHPDAEKYYHSIVQNSQKGESFCASPTSSPRSLLVWQAEGRISPFFVKLSLDRTLDGWKRTIKTEKVAKPVAINPILKDSDYAEMSFLPESFGLSPRGPKAAGMVIRPIPQSVLEKHLRLIPFFALYGQPKNGDAPYFVSMMNRTTETPEAYLTRTLIGPFAHFMVTAALEQGIALESHGQNLLLELDPEGQLAGKFYYRDLEGVQVDLPYRKKLGLNIPEHLPDLPTLTAEKNPKADQLTADWMYWRFNWFLRTLQELNTRIPQWTQRGLLRPNGIQKDTLKRLFALSIAEELHRRFPSDPLLSDDLDENYKVIARKRDLIP